jgi:hypothetical protein
MRTTLRFLIASLLLLVANVVTTQAEVKKVQMKIAGYLCGN